MDWEERRREQKEATRYRSLRYHMPLSGRPLCGIENSDLNGLLLPEPVAGEFCSKLCAMPRRAGRGGQPQPAYRAAHCGGPHDSGARTADASPHGGMVATTERPPLGLLRLSDLKEHLGTLPSECEAGRGDANLFAERVSLFRRRSAQSDAP